MGYAIVEVDLDRADAPPVPTGVEGALVIGRRGGLPVASCLLNGALPSDGAGLRRALVERASSPPPRAAGALALTVAVCTKDRPELLTRCLGSIMDAVAAAGEEVDAEVLVIDNASSGDGTRQAAEAAGARCEREEVPGLDVARNRAVATARGEVLAFVDDDVVVDRLWVRTIARAFQADPAAVAVTGHVLAYKLDTSARIDFERSGGFALGWDAQRYTTAERGDLPFVPFLGIGCNMAFRRDLFERIGRFDEALDTGRPLPGAGDLDILIRAVMDGPLVYEPSAVVFHEHRSDHEALRYQFYTWGKSWSVLLLKWYRLAPSHRPALRRAARIAVRGYGRDIVFGPRRGIYRRVHAVLMAVGFVTGAAGAYGRSQRRMAERRTAAEARVASAAPVAA